MEIAYSTPITELPSFLSTISMVVDDRSSIIRRLRDAERKSPAFYAPARDHFLQVLQGKFTFEQALGQAEKLPDKTERKCAVDVLKASEDFLKIEPSSRISLLHGMSIILPNGMKLVVSPIWLRHLTPERILVLHFWETPLRQRQLSAAAAVLKKALLRDNSPYLSCEIDFISTSAPDKNLQRRLKQYSWQSIQPLSDTELDRFLKLICEAWSVYRRSAPRAYKKRTEATLFDKR